MAVLNLIGEKYNRLLVVERCENTNTNKSRWKCLCDCGNETIVVGSQLKSGKVKSCGCYNKELVKARNYKHGLESKKICHVYRSMLSRCTNPNNVAYKDYGGRGIFVCQEWIGEEGLKNFAEWAYANGYDENAPKGKCTIDRIDVNGNYSPENCRFVDVFVQANNKRNNIFITYKGETKTLEQWCRQLNLSRSMIKHRYERGWAVDDLFNIKRN